MNASLFSGFRIVTEMENPIQSPKLSRSAFNSPMFKAKTSKLDDVESFNINDDNFIEPILKENPTRFTLFPIQKPKLFQKYKNHVAVFWTP